ncbi:signal peptidase I [Apilactobacillus kunkeei]|uniref:signal peptidase I n=1 Tax=Apilactobacillus kunkeei TaxID=148814 RepID=UPI00200B102C|nr:signal peptidase I [Apilactobacillus kunkeei]MCK8618731.1 signal peptidase I [Apilactobacillus kunkeei]CAI2699550.1 Signal peptidase IB [Apilactobacillus kunkeei]
MEKSTKNTKNKFLRECLSWLIYLVVLGAVYLTITHFFTMATVDGESMDPNLYNGEKMLVLKQSEVKRNSVIIFDAHGEDPEATANEYYVKRVIGLPGDTVSYKDGKLYVNNKVVDQSFISKKELNVGTRYKFNGDIIKNWDISKLSSTKWVYNQDAKVVPKGEYFVLGDNRSVSNDSRYWGFVKKSKVLGVAKLFPWSGTAKHRHNVNDLAK